MSRLLGIDLGGRRIGIAIADEVGRGARPLTTIIRARDVATDAATIARIAGEQRAGELVVGLPLSLDGSVGAQAAETTAWAERVGALTGLPVSLRDERFTTVRATERVGRARRARSGAPPTADRRRARDAKLDREAAVLILQAELDARRATS